MTLEAAVVMLVTVSMAATGLLWWRWVVGGITVVNVELGIKLVSNEVGEVLRCVGKRIP